MKPDDGPFQPVDAQLMLLAAGELPAADAQALSEQMQADPALAARYEALSDEMTGLESLLSAADQAHPISVRARRVAEQEAARTVRAWLTRDAVVEPRVATPSAIETAVWHYARWPLAAAAAIVVGLIVLPPILDRSNGGLRAERQAQELREGSSGQNERGGFSGFDGERRRMPAPEMRAVDAGDPRIETAGVLGSGEPDSGERLASLFDHPGQWTDGDGESGMALRTDLRDELATLQALGDAWSDDGF